MIAPAPSTRMQRVAPAWTGAVLGPVRPPAIPAPVCTGPGLDALLGRFVLPHEGPAALRELVSQGHGALPLPGHGQTLLRWRVFARLGAQDLALAKLFESHADALAIQAELGATPQGDGTWGVWCAEPPAHRVHATIDPDDAGRLRLTGVKAWCSGAAHLSHALVSTWDAESRPQLAAVALDQPGVRVTGEGWHATGMAGTDSVNVGFEDAVATPVGGPGEYVHRPGFLHGAAGVAACWYGAADRIARHLLQAARTREIDAHAQAHLGSIDVALVQARAQLRLAAAEIDAHPDMACELPVQRARLAVEHAANIVLEHATRALGAGPLCKDAGFGRLVADLPVFMRQSHAERDLAVHGRDVARLAPELPWTL